MTICSKGNRCKEHRTCEVCALARSYAFAERAERNIPADSIITYAVIRPSDPEATNKIRKTISKWSSMNHQGHCWSVETGTSAYGLHVNIIIASEQRIPESDIVKAIGTATDIWTEQIRRKEFKTVARYITKQKGMPKKEEHRGNLSGRSGCMLNPIDALARTSLGYVSLIAQDIKLEQAGIPADYIHSEKPHLKHLPHVSKVVRKPHAYEEWVIDNQGQVVKNPDYVNPYEGKT